MCNVVHVFKVKGLVGLILKIIENKAINFQENDCVERNVDHLRSLTYKVSIITIGRTNILQGTVRCKGNVNIFIVLVVIIRVGRNEKSSVTLYGIGQVIVTILGFITDIVCENAI